jgi:Xaa-Pro aminopeptidase
MISQQELERRWALTREAMRQGGLDWVVCTAGYPFGYARWFTGRPAVAGTLVAFPAQGDLVLATHGDPVHHQPQDSPGVKHVATCAQPNLLVNNHAGVVIERVLDTRPRRIGFLGMGYLPSASYVAFTKAMPEVDFVDATDMVAAIKSVKSEEEIQQMRNAAELHDRAIEVAKRSLRPGVTARHVMEDVRTFFCRAGSAAQTLMAGSAPPGQPCKYAGPLDRVIQQHDQFALLIECSNADGYYSEALPMMCVGKIPEPLTRAYGDMREIQDRLVSMLRPGASPAELLRVNDDMMIAKGYPPEMRLLGHSQGIDLVERPALTPSGENLLLQKNMVFSVHPTVHAQKAWAFPLQIGFLITDTTPVPMLRTPNDIIVV